MNKILEKIYFWIPTKNHPLKKDLQYSVLSILPLGMVILAFFYNNPIEILDGLWKIIIANDVFASDYTVIGNTGAALFNSGILVLINIYILRRLDLKLNGMIISAIFLIAGFSFVGKNICNIWPFYIGGYIYSKVRKIDFKNTVITSMYSTSLAPVVSILAHTFSVSPLANIILASLIGVFIGYVMPEIASQILMAHSGYNLYNTGFATGFVGIVVNSILNAFGKPVSPQNIVNTNFDYGLLAFFSFYFLLLIFIGFRHNNENFNGYSKLLSYSGRLITDFTRLCGFPISLINIGIMGLIAIIYVVLMGGVLNGPAIAAMCTVAGFSAFGNHPRNSVSILIGVAIAARFLNIDLSNTTLIISALFGTTLAPIVGEFGFIHGLILGPLHLALVYNIATLHAGLNLYNNGLSGGIIAMLFVPVFDAFYLEKRR